MNDRVYMAFLHNSLIQAMELAGESDVLRVVPRPPLPPAEYHCEFRVPYLRWLPSGLAEVAPGPVRAALRFPADYLRACDPHLAVRVASILTTDIAHPNILGPVVCLGAGFAAGMPIRALLWELYEIIAYRNITVDEHDALNPGACRLLREHRHLLDRLAAPPLRRPRRPSRIAVKA